MSKTFILDSVCNNAACGYDEEIALVKTLVTVLVAVNCVSKPGCSFADDSDLKVGWRLVVSVEWILQ